MIREDKVFFQDKGNKLNIAICDDKEALVRKLFKELNRLMEKSDIQYEIFPFVNPVKLLECKEPIHILFLDIDMPQMNGLNTAKEAAEKWNDVKIIFLTAYLEYVQKAFKVKTFRYLLKPFKEEDIKEALFEAMDIIFEKHFKLIKIEEKIVQIDIPEIYYIEALGDQSAVFRKDDYVICNVSLREWELDNYSCLYRCNRNYIINFLHVDKIKDKVLLTNGKELPVAVRKRRQIKENYYIFRRERARILWE